MDGDPKPGPRRRTALRIVLVVGVLVLMAVALKDKAPSPASILAALRKANWWYVGAALLLQIGSFWLQVHQQRRLLRAFGVPVSTSRVGAITTSSTAISMSMPAGGAVSAGYSYRQYRANGASPAVAASVLLLSGVASMAALMALTAAGIGATWLHGLIRRYHQPWWEFIALGLGLAMLVELLAVILFIGGHRKRRERRTVLGHGFLERHPKLDSLFSQLSSTTRQAADLPRSDWRFVLLSSAGNWALDAACLYACCLAFSIHIRVLTLGAVYVGTQLVRQIPITPGGIGVIEASLLAGLVAAHAGKGAAGAAVLVYRLFSAWLVLPAGFAILAARRRTGGSGSSHARRTRE